MNNVKVSEKKKREPLFHITKRTALNWKLSFGIRAAAILGALIFMTIVFLLLSKENPIVLYKTMFEGAFGNPLRTWILFSNTAILLGISLALTPAFKMKFWNCGGEGQVIIASLITAMIMFFVGDSVPYPVLVVIMLLSSLLIGAIWAVLPAIFKSKWNTNETLFTLMMNYIAIQLVAYFVLLWENPKGSSIVGIINSSTGAGYLPVIGGKQYLLPILIVALVTGVMYIYLRYTKQGYEISVVGESQNTAKYVGINVKKVIIRTMIISGALCGLAGFLFVSGIDYTINANLIGGLGFTAIMVSWLAKFNPVYMIMSSFLIVFLDRGASEIATDFRLNESIADALTGIILFFIIGSEFFIQYQLKFRKRGNNK